MAVLTIAGLKDEINEFIASNGTAAITGMVMNSVLFDLVDSVVAAAVSTSIGTTAPNNANGYEGDLYFQTNVGIYRKTSGVWILTFSVDSNIVNQNSVPQVANFWINGTGKANNIQVANAPGVPTDVMRLEDMSSYQTILNYTPENVTNKNIANGYAGLDSNGLLLSSQYPAGIDKVLEFANLASFPNPGSFEIIYLALDQSKQYRWSGSMYIPIIASPGTTDAIPEGSVNLYYTNARVAAYGNTLYPQLASSYNNPSWITGLAWSKLNGTVPNVSIFANDANYITTASLFYQTIASNGTNESQRGILNFGTQFSLTDSSINNWTTVAISSVNWSIISSKPTTLAGYGIVDAYPLSGNPSGFLTSFSETDPTVPSYAKTLTAFSVIQTSTDPLYRPITYVPSFASITSKPTTISGFGITDAYTKAQSDTNYEPAITISTSTKYWRGDKTFQTLDTSAVTENTNLYYTSARFDSAFGAKTTDNLTEGSSNKYYHTSLFNTDFASQTTSNLAEGTNLYYTQTRFNTAFSAKTTDDLSEGSTNLYYTNARAQTFSDTRYLQLSGGTMTGFLTLSGDPTSALHPASKNYVDNLIAGLSFIDKAADAASIANVTVSSAPVTLDGFTGISGTSRWLLKNQTTASENGVYLFNGTGSALTRTVDASTGAQLSNKTVPVSSGTTQADTWWTITNDTITIGVTSINIVQTGGSGTYAASSGISLTGNLFTLDTTFTRNLISATSPIFYSGGVISSQSASGSQNGYLISTDWSAFNNKQAAGNYITSLTGDATASGPGAAALTLANVNSNIGTFNNVTVNAKGQATAASNVTYLTSNQTITLTGDVSGSGTTSITTSIGSGAVTNAMLAGSISLTTKVTGILPVANGGSGTSTAFTTGSIVFAGASGVYSQNNNNLFFNNSSGIISINTSGDTSGTDAINSYNQHDSYNPQSVIGSSVNGLSTPGISASTSRGTGASPVISNTGDIIGNHGFWAYTGSSPAYTNMAGMVGSAVGTTASNLGGQLDFYTKANNASTYTTWLSIFNNGTINSNAQVTFNPTISASSSLAQGFIYTPNLTAVSNNDVLIGNDSTLAVSGVGIINTLSSITTAGSSYTNGTYNGVALINGNGSAATANIVITGNAVSTCTLVLGGTRFTVGDILSVAAASVGGTGSGFTITVASLTQTVTGSVIRANVTNLGQSTPIISGYFGDGLILKNTTAATSTLSQNTPTLRLQSFGWGTTAPASELVEWVMYATTASAATPSTVLNIRSIVNGTATSSTTSAQFQYSTSGTFTAATAFNAIPGALGAATKDAFNASNGSTATAGTPVQFGPGYSTQANVWNTSALASQPVYMGWHMEPVSANPVSAIMVWSTKLNGGAEAKIMSLTSAGALGVGIGTAAAANIESLLTTEQLRLSYDGSNHSSFTTSSGGNLTIAPSGATTNITGALNVSQSVTLGNTNSNIYIGSANSVFQNTALAQFQYASSSTSSFRTAFYGVTSAILAANNNYTNILVANSQVTLPATGTTAWVANAVINTLGTITNGSAIPLTNTAVLWVGTPSAAGTNNYSIYNIGVHAMAGTTSGVISLTPQAAAGTYNWNWPTTAGLSGQALISAGGSSSVMTWAYATGVVATADLTSQTAAVSSVATFTVGSSTGTFRIGAYLNITAVTLDVIQVSVTYTDENNTSQTAIFYGMGSTSAGLSAIGNSNFGVMDLRCKNATAITVKTTLTTGTGSITYDTGATIQQLR